MHDDRLPRAGVDHIEHLSSSRAGEQQIRGLRVRKRRRLVEHFRRVDGQIRRVAALHPEGEDLVAHGDLARADTSAGADR